MYLTVQRGNVYNTGPKLDEARPQLSVNVEKRIKIPTEDLSPGSYGRSSYLAKAIYGICTLGTYSNA